MDNILDILDRIPPAQGRELSKADLALLDAVDEAREGFVDIPPFPGYPGTGARVRRPPPPPG